MKKLVLWAVGGVAGAALLGAAAFEVIAGAGSGWLRIPAGLVLLAFVGAGAWHVSGDEEETARTAELPSAAPGPRAGPPPRSELGFGGIPDEELEAIVSRTVAALPRELRDQIVNLAFVIEEEPPPGKSWLATYQGIPLTESSVFQPWQWPHKITLYRVPLRRIAGNDPARLEQEVAHTVRHELAHYFGIDDGRLVELGAY